MLKPNLFVLAITEEIRQRIQPRVMAALFDTLESLKPKHRTSSGIPSLTVSEAKERLVLALPVYKKTIGDALPVDWNEGAIDPVDVGNTLHEWIKEAILFFRRNGAESIRSSLPLTSPDLVYEHVWRSLFHQKLVSIIQSSGMLSSDGGVRTCDLVVECLKLWTRKVCESLTAIGSGAYDPSAYFLDVETDLEGTLRLNGNTLHLRGRPDAIFLDPTRGEVHLWEYKFGRQGQYELQVAQVLLYMSLIEAAKGVACNTGFLTVFRPTIETRTVWQNQPGIDNVAPPFPEEVEKVFAGYIGNEAAVHSLKVKLTLALREDPPRMASNIMLCGPGGLGKTELARRVASALKTPLIDVPATSFKNLGDLLDRIDMALGVEGREPEEDGTDAGLPKFKYPPLALFVDEAHKLSRRADEFLNFFEPKERRAVGPNRVGDFKNATILLATTDKGKLPSPFLTRFIMIDLIPYTVEQVGEMVRLEFRRTGKEVARDVCERLARIGRLIPRSALLKTGDFLEHHAFQPDSYPLTLRGLDIMMEHVWLVDNNGLTKNDMSYLTAVEEGPRGISALCSLLPCQREEIESVIEPFLFQIGAIKATQRGREITEHGRIMLASHGR